MSKKVRIVNIHPDDAWFRDRDKLIGVEGKFTYLGPYEVDPEYKQGDFSAKNCEAHYFLAVKVKPVKKSLKAKIKRLKRKVADLREQLETIKVAAHMPEDYQYGLPSWINQRLYMAYIGAHISPILLEQIEKGQITFPNSPAERENADLRRQQHEGEMETK